MPETPKQREFESAVTFERFHNSGLYGQIWKGRQGNPERDVAIKVVNPEHGMYFNALEHAKGLVRAGAHKNIVTVYMTTRVRHPETGIEADAIVMEWLDGETLGAALGNRKFGLREAKKICLEILEGVNHLHTNGLTHNDLNTGNIVLTVDGVKIIDIDYSSDRSLRNLSDASRQERIKGDINSTFFLLAMVLRHSAIAVDVWANTEPRLRSAQELSEMRLVLLEIGEAEVPAVPTPQSQVQSISRQIEDAIESGLKPTLRRLVISAAKETTDKLRSDHFSSAVEVNAPSINGRVLDLGLISRKTAEAVATLSFHSNDEYADELIVEAIDLILNAYESEQAWSGPSAWHELRAYPALITMYAAGIGAIAARNYRTLRCVINKPKFHGQNEIERPFTKLLLSAARAKNLWKQIAGKDLICPVNAHLEQVLRPVFVDLVPQDSRFEKAFDRFEFFVGLAEYAQQPRFGRRWGPIGSFIWRRKGEKSVGNEFRREVADLGNNWGPIKAGMFDGSLDAFESTIQAFEEFVGRVRDELGAF